MTSRGPRTSRSFQSTAFSLSHVTFCRGGPPTSQLLRFVVSPPGPRPAGPLCDVRVSQLGAPRGRGRSPLRPAPWAGALGPGPWASAHGGSAEVPCREVPADTLPRGPHENPCKPGSFLHHSPRSPAATRVDAARGHHPRSGAARLQTYGCLIERRGLVQESSRPWSPRKAGGPSPTSPPASRVGR